MIKQIERAPGYVPFNGSPLAEACEELRDEMMTMETKPKAEDYKAFRRSRVSVSVSSTGYASTSLSEHDNAYGREILKVIAGDYPRAQLEQLGGIEAGRVIPLRPEQIIGRAQTADVVVLSPQITRHHTRIMAQRGKFFVMDLGSSNGTWLNEARVETHVLSQGDIIGVSDVKFRYQEVVEAPEPRLMAISSDGNIYVVEKDRLFVMGRSRACTMVIDSEKVGRQHAAVRFREAQYWFEDYGSEHGTVRPNGQKITERLVITDGDEFLLGGYSVKFVFRT
jgi:pSer/pThr/pTyr-binding forkhead associated (FHA) protein